ncbi:MAG: hypothetical protein ACO1N9_02645 [Flavobacterium sp.]
MRTPSNFFFLVLVFSILSCKDKQIEIMAPETEYDIYYNGASVTVYDNNDTIYLNHKQTDKIIKIASDSKTTDSIRSSVRRHLNYKNLAHKHIEITDGGGGYLTVSMNRGNNHLEISHSGMESITEFRNLAGLFLLLEKNYPEIDKAF